MKRRERLYCRRNRMNCLEVFPLTNNVNNTLFFSFSVSRLATNRIFASIPLFSLSSREVITTPQDSTAFHHLFDFSPSPVVIISGIHPSVWPQTHSLVDIVCRSRQTTKLIALLKIWEGYKRARLHTHTHMHRGMGRDRTVKQNLQGEGGEKNK